MMRTAYFWQLPIGALFECNGNRCEKVSRRTALLLDYGRVFYFGRLETCKTKGE